MLTAHHLSWGNVLFDLNNEEFRQAFSDGRRYYYADIHIGYPERAITLTAQDVLSYVLVPDTRTGQYRFDYQGKNHPVETLGVFLGYATAPLFPETPEEQVQCRQRYKSASLLSPLIPASGTTGNFLMRSVTAYSAIVNVIATNDR